jgi:hypothetical protein
VKAAAAPRIGTSSNPPARLYASLFAALAARRRRCPHHTGQRTESAFFTGLVRRRTLPHASGQNSRTIRALTGLRNKFKWATSHRSAAHRLRISGVASARMPVRTGSCIRGDKTTLRNTAIDVTHEVLVEMKCGHGHRRSQRIHMEIGEPSAAVLQSRHEASKILSNERHFDELLIPELKSFHWTLEDSREIAIVAS